MPTKVPTKLKKLRGNPGRRPFDENEPDPTLPAKFPMPPKELGEDARKFWFQNGPELYNLGLLTVADLPAFEMACNIYGRIAYAERLFASESHDMPIVKTKSGNIIPNPLLGVINTQLSFLLKFMKEFGMTPAARVGLSVNSQSEDDIAQEYLDFNIK